MRTSMRLALAIVGAVRTGPTFALRRYIGRKCCKNFAISRAALSPAQWRVECMLFARRGTVKDIDTLNATRFLDQRDERRMPPRQKRNNR